jgi:hypothetical protein
MEDPPMPQNQFDNSARAGRSRTPRTAPRHAPATVAHLGTAAALTTVNLSGRKLGEFQRAARRAALVALQTAVPRNQAPVAGPDPGARGPGPIASAPGKPGGPGPGPARRSSPFESARAGEIADLVWNVVTVVTYSVARLVEVIAGPIERLIDPDPAVYDDQWLLLGPVPAGGRTTGSFSLLNSAQHDAEVGVLLSNPPANTSGVIPVDRVVFRPQPATVPGNGTVEVAVSAQIPSSTSPGRYLGVVRSNEVPDLTLVLEIVVV